MKIHDLSGYPLDYAVAIALGFTRYPEDSCERGSIWHMDKDRSPFGRIIPVREFMPSRNARGNMIIDEHHISVVWDGEKWGATMHVDNVQNGQLMYGMTRLIAAMRCFAGHRLGTKIAIPPDIFQME